MNINVQAAARLVETAVNAIQEGPGTFPDVLDPMPAAVYVTDRTGTITYFNPACIDFAGRTPQAGVDKWCVTWKLRTLDGEHLPHDECPMAIALREAKPVREVEAIAERPDGGRVHFVPFPTPVFDANGDLAGAVNLLLDVTEQRTPQHLKAQAEKCRRLARSMTHDKTAETLHELAAKYEEQARRCAH